MDYKPPPIALDFDGVLHDDTPPWRGPAEILGEPTLGALEAVQEYCRAGLNPVVYSCRALDPAGKVAIETWLHAHGFPPMQVVGEKPWACLYVDDRGYQFDGTNWPSAQYVKSFVPWTKTDTEWAKKKKIRGMAKKFGRIRELR